MSKDDSFVRLVNLHEDSVSAFKSTKSLFATNDEYEPNFFENSEVINGEEIIMEVSAEKVNRMVSTSDLKSLFSQLGPEDENIPWHMLARTKELCSLYLGGVWTSISSDQFTLKKIRGGMSNMLFLVELGREIKPVGHEPSCALLRIHCNVDLRHLLNESVIFTLLSERCLGPKLFGVFPGGRFEEYIHSRSLRCEELSISSLLIKIGAMMARIHSLDVPTSKQPMLIEVARIWLSKIRENDPDMAIEMRVNMAHADLSKSPELITCDLLSNELEQLQSYIVKGHSPVVFCHNDLQEGNILLRTNCHMHADGNFSPESSVEPLVVIDYEYANYNYRGFDFANHMCENILDYSNDKPPYYFINEQNFPSVEKQKLLINAYLDEIEKIVMYSKVDNPSQCRIKASPHSRELSVEKLLLETKRFIPTSHLLWSIWSFMQAGNSPIEFDYISYGLDRLALYFQDKENLNL